MTRAARFLARPAYLSAVLALAACSTKSGDAGTDTAAPATASTAPAPAAATTDSARKDSAAGGAAMSDANILAQEHGGDSAEVAIAGLARKQAGDARVRAYATLLVDDHANGEREVEALAKKLSITPQPAPDDTASQETAHTLARLGALHGHDFDTAFVRHEITDHKTDIDDAHKAAASAHDPQVKSLVEKSIPELQKHLDRAQALDSALVPHR